MQIFQNLFLVPLNRFYSNFIHFFFICSVLVHLLFSLKYLNIYGSMDIFGLPVVRLSVHPPLRRLSVNF
jgi:ABC-type microcin C transport system permease subunit YejB